MSLLTLLLSTWALLPNKISCFVSNKKEKKNLRNNADFSGSSAGKNPPAMQETPVQFLGQEDPLEKG